MVNKDDFIEQWMFYL